VQTGAGERDDDIARRDSVGNPAIQQKLVPEDCAT
jgi:hypothetical protein